MYKFLYDSWDTTRFPGYADSISHLYDTSIDYKTHNYPEEDRAKDLLKLDEIFGYLEYFLAGAMKKRYIGRSNFHHALDQLKGIQLVKLLAPSLRSRLNGLTLDHIVTLNPEPGNYPGLDQTNSLQLSLYHELGHIITSANREDLEVIKQYIFRTIDFESDSAVCQAAFNDLGKGFDLLDEVCVQNVAENILFDRNHEPRPSMKLIRNKLLYPTGTMRTNFVEYREFQELAYRFASCLSFLGCSPEEDMNSVLDKLSKAMFSKDFCTKLFQEFASDDDKAVDLSLMLICMGKIKEAKYSSFGLGTIDSDQLDMTKFFELFDSLAKRNEPKKEVKKESSENVKTQS